MGQALIVAQKRTFKPNSFVERLSTTEDGRASKKLLRRYCTRNCLTEKDRTFFNTILTMGMASSLFNELSTCTASAVSVNTKSRIDERI